MQLTEDDVRAFIAIWREEFQETISFDEAKHRASLLIDLYLLLYGPDAPTK